MKLILLLACWNFILTLQSLIMYVQMAHTVNAHTIAILLSLLLLFTLNGTYLAYILNPFMPKKKKAHQKDHTSFSSSDHPSRNVTQTITLPDKK